MDVILASANAHKFKEFLDMVVKAKLELNFYSPDYIGGMPEVEESGQTLEENARLKAQELVKHVPKGTWVLADDSGLLVDALNGAPGVRSARFAGPSGNAVANNLKLLMELKGVPMEKRSARFSCVIHFQQAGGSEHVFKGICEGHILEHPQGDKGFGYDPLFRPQGYDKSFAELGSREKNRLSHRGQAFAQWADFVSSRPR